VEISWLFDRTGVAGGSALNSSVRPVQPGERRRNSYTGPFQQSFRGIAFAVLRSAVDERIKPHVSGVGGDDIRRGLAEREGIPIGNTAGTTGNQVEIRVDPAGLNANTYSGTVTFQQVGNPMVQLSVPVTLRAEERRSRATQSAQRLRV
jgi:hypothetical protein